MIEVSNYLLIISEKSGAVILLVHHVNKDIISNGNMDMASGAGLTSIMRSLKCIMGLQLDKLNNLNLVYLKANALTSNEKYKVVFLGVIRYSLFSIKL